jgi:glutaredoxin
MKSLTLVRLLGLVTLLVTLAGIPLYGQGLQEPTSQDPAAQSQPSMKQQSTQNQVPQIFVGKIARSKGNLVLNDDAGALYKLDNTDQAKQFIGKTVTVTGTLDASTNTIHVANMEAPSS